MAATEQGGRGRVKRKGGDVLSFFCSTTSPSGSKGFTSPLCRAYQCSCSKRLRRVECSITPTSLTVKYSTVATGWLHECRKTTATEKWADWIFGCRDRTQAACWGSASMQLLDCWFWKVTKKYTKRTPVHMTQQLFSFSLSEKHLLVKITTLYCWYGAQWGR